MGSIVRHSKGAKNRIIFANPHSAEPRREGNWQGNHKRQNVSVKMTYDEGDTWPVHKVVEPGPSGYSDLAVGPGGTVYLFYERGAVKAGSNYIKTLTVARFNIEWLTDGKDR